MKLKAKVRLEQDENKPVEVKLKDEYIQFSKNAFKDFVKAMNNFEELKDLQKQLAELGGKKNMIVMISQPMNGRRNDDIKKEREEIIERFKRLHIDVIDSLIEDTADPKTYNEYHPALYYLARSIELMGQVDAVYFADGWQEARGCRIERQIAEEYNIKILESSFLYPEKNRGFDINKITITPCKEDRIFKPDYQITCTNEKHIPRLD